MPYHLAIPQYSVCRFSQRKLNYIILIYKMQALFYLFSSKASHALSHECAKAIYQNHIFLLLRRHVVRIIALLLAISLLWLAISLLRLAVALL